MVTDRPGAPVGVATDAADVSEVRLGSAALACVAAATPVASGTPVRADRGYHSDQPRDHPATAAGRACRRPGRRWIGERTFARLHGLRRPG